MLADNPKVVLVTGASRGLGAAIAKDIGSHGHKVIVNYAGSKDKADAVVEEIKKAGGDAIAVQADCSDQASIQAMFKTGVDAFGGIDVLINNAGITADGPVMSMKKEKWLAVIDTNLSGVFYASQEFFKLNSKKKMKEGAGRIINMASIVGQIGNKGQANYAAAKGGVIAMGMSMAREFCARGITVNTICPGFITSDMTNELSEAQKEGSVAMIPMGRFGEPEEVAGMARFLALDPAANYITGHTFNVDGGMAIGA
jgi:3-oxoacyl-[acyl-carrier protein] reductase